MYLQKVFARFARPVAVGQLLVGEVSALVYVRLILDTRELWTYLLLAAAHLPWAVFADRCHWWNPDETQWPRWLGRLSVGGAACGWILFGWYFSK
jgi:hypothetical protein